jgi:alkyl sulfatase BDS1-like metallo-beta-lactamase superfamily hydrolase
MPRSALLALLVTLAPWHPGTLPSRAAEPDLAAHSAEFKRQVIKVTDGVHVAVGYGLANSILIEGDKGLIIVDTLECAESAQAVREEFRKISRKPIRAIIYTHHHADHVFGAGVFVARDHPEIIAHESLPREFERSIGGARPIIVTRGQRMFGMALEDRQRLNCGVGPALFLNERNTVAYRPPTRTFRDRLSLTIEGVRLELVHAPGETDDHLFVWLPQHRALLCGDNFYHSFPNLYTIRGTPYRKVRDWIASLDKMRDLRPEHLVPSHTRPLAGAKLVEVLTSYRDAIQYVHDQTLRGLNPGRTPDELADSIKLPPHLAQSPYLQEYYGKVSWSVRSICNGHLGWFDGDSTNLLPLPPVERAKRMAELAGGEDALLKRAEEAFARKDHQWALELTSYLIALKPANKPAQSLRARVLTALGEAQGNSPARNYYLSQAWEIRNPNIKIGKPGLNREAAHALSLGVLFESLAIKLDPQASKDVDRRACFRFRGSSEVWTIHVRRSVAEIRSRADADAQLQVTADISAWKEVLTALRRLDDALNAKQITALPDGRQLREFLALFPAK